MTPSLIIGLVGTNGAGKSTVCDYLEAQGFGVFSLSAIIHDETRQRGLELNRDNLVATANELKATHGQDVLAQKTYDKVQSLDHAIVLDSVRNQGEVDYLKSKGVIFVGVDAPIELRYERIQSRQRESDKIDFDTFKRHDERENTGQSSGQNINAALEHCSYRLSNDSSADDLHQKIDTLITQLKDR